jgi:hypothetical protein
MTYIESESVTNFGGGIVRLTHLNDQLRALPWQIYGSSIRVSCASALLILLFLILVCSISCAQTSLQKNVLILNEVGLSHSLTSEMTQQIVSGVLQAPNRNVEFYSESLDLS